jgi:type IV pilus assembly protein PilP
MRAVVVIVLGLLLVACGGEEFGDLKSELKERTKELRGRIAPLPVVKPYEPVPYTVLDQPDPFSAAKIELVIKSAGGGAGGGLKPDLNRPKEPLEAYPLESLKMVGAIQQKNANYGLVKADTGLYRVKVGNYMGQNFGVIVGISDNEIKLKELVQDGTGDWTERSSTLQLADATDQRQERRR